MFYQEALLIFRFLSRVDSLLTIGERHWQKSATMFEKAESANSLPFAGVFSCGVPVLVWVLINGDVVVVIKMGAYIHGLCGCLLSSFCSMSFHIIFINIIIFTDLPTARRVVEETGSSSRRG